MLPQRAPEIFPVSETELEPLYRVLIHNDDVTPMDFVVHILRAIFIVIPPDAVNITFEAHYNGTAYVQNPAQN